MVNAQTNCTLDKLWGDESEVAGYLKGLIRIVGKHLSDGDLFVLQNCKYLTSERSVVETPECIKCWAEESLYANRMVYPTVYKKVYGEKPKPEEGAPRRKKFLGVFNLR